MKSMQVAWQSTSQVSEQALEKEKKRLQPEHERMHAAYGMDYDTDYAFLNLPNDKQMLVATQEAIAQKLTFDPSALVVVGIGGSNLATKAIMQALYGSFYNNNSPKIKIYFADTVDADYISDIMQQIESLLQQRKVVLLNVVSKSGTTTETIVNFRFFVDLIKKYHPNNYEKHVIITTDYNSKLWDIGKKQQYTCLEIPKNVGGRYSALSPVGLFPLGLIGVDLVQLREGAHQINDDTFSHDYQKSLAVITAALISLHYARGIAIHDTFLFSKDLHALGLWYRQLLAESVGKEFMRDGTRGVISLLPTVSMGSIDLHSVAQRYLGGASDIFTTFVTVAQNKTTITVPEEGVYDSLVPNISKKEYRDIMHAILTGTQHAYKQKKLPFVVCTLPKKEAFFIGQFMQWKMLETVYLGFLFGVNPFDQPHVELYKKETRKMLAYE